MSGIETKVFKLLNSNEKLVVVMNSIRGKPIDNSNGIWKHDIPPDFHKKENAPFIRLSPIFEGDFGYADDNAMSEEQRIQVTFWTKSDTDSEKIKNCLDDILKANDFTRYTANENPRYLDADIGLLINHRKYRFFDWKN